jgi:hypothetical protein
MLSRFLAICFATIVVSLTLSTSVQSWGGYHVGYTHYSPYTGLQHHGYTRAYGGGYGGYRYGGDRYGGGYARYGYYRRY